MKQTRTWWAVGIGIVLLALLFLTFINPDDPPDFALFLGRFHTILVHFPIGLLLIAALLEALVRLPRFAHLNAAIPVLLLAGAAGAVVAMLAGLYLALGGGYDEDTIYWHKRLGIGVAIGAFLVVGLKTRAHPGAAAGRRKTYLVVLVVLIGAITVGGHLGGTLTHGSGYLTRYLPDPLRRLVGGSSGTEGWMANLEDVEEAVLYSDLIQPILEDRCVTCHNPSKRKGRLELNTPEGILKGGEEGEIFVAGRSSESEMMRRILLPPDHEDHMPPEGKPPLTVAEAALIRWWIDQGASFDQSVAEAEMTPIVQQIFDGLELPERKTGIFALEVPAADSAAIEALRDLGVSVEPLAEEEPFLHVRCPQTDACFGEAQAQALLPLAPQVAWLDLGHAQVNDSTLVTLASLPHLTRLHLEQTSITDAGLAHLKGLPYLEYLNLYGTNVSDAGLEHLAELPALKALYLWQTQATEAGAQRLQEALPDLDVNLGWTPVTPAAQTDGASE